MFCDIIIIVNPKKFETQLPRIFISLFVTRIKLIKIRITAATIKGIIVCFAKPKA